MDLTLRDILEQLYDEAYWAAEASRTSASHRLAKSEGRREAAVTRAAELIEPLRDQAGGSGDFTEMWGAGDSCSRDDSPFAFGHKCPGDCGSFSDNLHYSFLPHP